MTTTPSRFKGIKKALKLFLLIDIVVSVLILGIFFGFFAPQIYHHFSLFPRQAEAWRALAAERTPVSLKSGWREFRGVMHSHSEVSHDSEATFPEIAEALHQAKCQFIFMSDHVVDGKADYSLGKKGMFDGILFVRGFEMTEGFMPWGLPDETILNNNDDPAALARQIHALGGVLCYSHCEASRPWELPEMDGMEIYNIHTDLLDELMEKHSRMEVAKEALINMYGYGDQTLRYMFDSWVLMMLVQKWDEKNLHRHITAMAANDIHQNVGMRGIYTKEGSLLLLDTGHNDPKDKIAEYPLNFLTRGLLRCCFGPLTPDRQLFRIDLDPYQRSARFVNTHLLAKELTEASLLEAFRAGRAFVAFNMIADAEGFAFIAQDGEKSVTMGESIPRTAELTLKAEAPLPCYYGLFRNGKMLMYQDHPEKAFEYAVTEPGKYRLQAFLPVPGEESFCGERMLRDTAPWILTNPIEVTETPLIP